MGGGKTQQRVAGNAKPANSGRIRELLMSQRMAPGSVITFSALSARNQQNKQKVTQEVDKLELSDSRLIANEQPDTATHKKAEASEPKRNEQDDVELTLQKTSSPNRDSNTRLVVRRVGNRDYYTRIKVTDDKAFDDSDMLVLAIKPSEAGVKKPPAEFSGQYLSESTHPTEKLDIEQLSVDAIDSSGTDDRSSEGAPIDPDEALDFFGLLDKLEQARVSLNANSKEKTLRGLDNKAIANELNFLRLIKILMKGFIQDLSLEDWDLISATLSKWTSWISGTHYPLQEAYQAEFCAEVFGFVHQLTVQAEKIQAQPDEVTSFPLMQSLLDDWANFRSSSIFLDLITLFLKLLAADNDETNQSNSTIRPMIEALAHIIISVDTRIVLTHHDLLNYLSAAIQFDQEFALPKSSYFSCINGNQLMSFQAICGLLRSNFRVTLVAAHSILSRIMRTICDNTQTNMLAQDQDSVDDVLIFPPEPLMAILTSRDSIMSVLLSDYRVGDISVTLEPNTDSYSCTLSYLFAWDLTIQYIVGVDKELGQCIIHSLKRIGLIQRLLDTVFMLLPPLDERDSLNFKIESSDKDEQAHFEWNIDAFLKSTLKTTVRRPVNEIELVALHLYFSVALHMPVTVRKWYNNNANKRLCNLVNEYTVKHISRVICSLEMESVQEKCQERANREESKTLTIKARPSAQEVYAIYTRDEFKMELTIKLPQNYPLGPVQIDGGKRVGVTDLKWRSWLLQLTTFLSHQNGPILDGIDLWRTNIDKRFEGVEKCTICFSILHSNYQLPKKKCQTCANMFHNLCLYKWFESSGNSTCPLCRNPW